LAFLPLEIANASRKQERGTTILVNLLRRYRFRNIIPLIDHTTKIEEVVTTTIPIILRSEFAEVPSAAVAVAVAVAVQPK